MNTDIKNKSLKQFNKYCKLLFPGFIKLKQLKEQCKILFPDNKIKCISYEKDVSRQMLIHYDMSILPNKIKNIDHNKLILLNNPVIRITYTTYFEYDMYPYKVYEIYTKTNEHGFVSLYRPPVSEFFK